MVPSVDCDCEGKDTTMSYQCGIFRSGMQSLRGSDTENQRGGVSSCHHPPTSMSSCTRDHHVIVPSGDHLVDHMAMDICEPHVPAAEEKGQVSVIDPHEVEHRGMKIVDLERVFHGPVPVLIG